MIPYRLPYSSPVERIDVVVTLHSSLLRPGTAGTSLGCTSGPSRDLWCRTNGPLGLALSAVPRPGWYLSQPNAVQMRRRITAITQEEHIFIICFTTDSAWLKISQVVLRILDHHRRVDFGDLYSVLDSI